MLYIYENLRYIRTSLKMSQNTFADKLDLNVSNISRWENSKNGMSLDTANIISQKLGISLADLVGTNLKDSNIDLNEIRNNLKKEGNE